jgi:hypothetical protein
MGGAWLQPCEEVLKRICHPRSPCRWRSKILDRQAQQFKSAVNTFVQSDRQTLVF